MTRARSLAGLVALVLVLAACSGSSDSAKPSTSTPGTSSGAHRITWKQAEADPCQLLPLDVLQKLLPKSGATAGTSGPRQCTFTLKADRTVTVDLYFAQTKKSLASRTAGVPRTGKVLMPVLVSPGAAILVRNGNALAQVAIRSAAGSDPAAATQIGPLAKAVGDRLPPAPAPPKGVDGRDPCDLVPVSTFPKNTFAHDVGTPLQCGYLIPDQTSVAVQVIPTPSSGSTPLIGDPWPAGGKGARWQESGPSGRGLVPVKGGTAVIDLSSPVRDQAKLMQLGATISKLMQTAAAG